MAHSHGTNDAQKTMGIITLALFAGTQDGAFNDLPPALQFLQTPEFTVPKLGHRHLRAHHGRGHRGGRLAHHPHARPQDGEAAAGARLRGGDDRRRHHSGRQLAGIPVSTTHVISTSIMGVGAVKRFGGVKWGVVERIIWAWVLTLPVTALVAYLLSRLALAL